MRDSLVALAHEVADLVKVMMEMSFTHAAHHSKICLCIVRDSLVALAHEVADPAKNNDETDFHTCSAPFQNQSVHRACLICSLGA